MIDEKLEELKKEYIGKVMTVEELAEKLPNLWVAIKIVERDPDDRLIVLSGKLLEIGKDIEAKQLGKKYRGDKTIRVMRTTCGMNVGYINGIYIKENG